MKNTLTPLALVAALTLAGAAAAQSAAPQSAASLVNTHPPGLDVAGMDRNVKPGDDFFAYANGGWIAKAEIPPDRSSWGPSGELGELTSARVQDLIQTAATAPAGSEARKIGDYYSAYLD